MDNVENIDPQDNKDENTSKKKRKVRKVRRKKVKKPRDDVEREAEEEEEEALREFQHGARFAKRKSSSLSLEVEKMAQGKQLTHFQVGNGLDSDVDIPYPLLYFKAMAMLRKALIASFIAKPKSPGKGEVEMKNTECRRPSQGKLEVDTDTDCQSQLNTIPVESVKCLVLKDEEESTKLNQEEEKVEEVLKDQISYRKKSEYLE